MGGGPAGGQHDDGRGLALVGGHDAGDGGGGGVVAGSGVLNTEYGELEREWLPKNEDMFEV